MLVSSWSEPGELMDRGAAIAMAGANSAEPGFEQPNGKGSEAP